MFLFFLLFITAGSVYAESTPLMSAAYAGNKKYVQYLLDKGGCPINAVDMLSWHSPLLQPRVLTSVLSEN